MDSLYLLIPIAIVLVAVGIRLLLWAIDSGQYDDLDKEAWRILSEENTNGTDTRRNSSDKSEHQGGTES